MFEEDDEVICIVDWNSDLIYGKKYIISECTFDNVEMRYYYRLYNNNNSMYTDYHFVTPLEFRRMKLNKIKERICLKSVIE